VLDGGPTTGIIPSTIVDFTAQEPEVLREGHISRDEILAVLMDK
jgi:tRNA A37 threonylcarbamoyladenosine synthetase subunit TsaC/SUA5/YrdC